MSEDIKTFRIDIPQEQLDDLRNRLEQARLPAPLPGDGWDTGVPTAWMRELVEYWRTELRLARRRGSAEPVSRNSQR